MGSAGHDNKAYGASTYGTQGVTRSYANFGVIYSNQKEARLLKPSLMPSSYYGRRPFANYIRKGYKLGIAVVPGFQQDAWDKLHPLTTSGPKTGTARAPQVFSSFSASESNNDATLPRAERPRVTDLIFVIHGIGQKLSERMESFHFTHAINAFRRQVNVESSSEEIRVHLRKGAGSVMVLPINWRHLLSFNEGGYSEGDESSTFTLADITPDTLPYIRSTISDVMLDILYYMSHHQPRMIAAVIKEANRVFKLWCENNPGFATDGCVHLIAHSLGSVMALDVLSNQPTKVPAKLRDPTAIDVQQLQHFAFDTSNLFLAGSPARFFLLMKKAQLVPRSSQADVKPYDPLSQTVGVCGERGQYGCIAVDNVYNIINPYDRVACRLNAAVDSAYSKSLKQATIPSATPGWFGVGIKSSSLFGATLKQNAQGKNAPLLPRLPSNVEMDVHNFTREEIAEKRMYLLNDNGQIDYFLKYGGGAFDIQYLTMLGAHSSYWSLKDFVRMIVTETGRRRGREGTFLGMRAVKEKASTYA